MRRMSVQWSKVAKLDDYLVMQYDSVVHSFVASEFIAFIYWNEIAKYCHFSCYTTKVWMHLLRQELHDFM